MLRKPFAKVREEEMVALTRGLSQGEIVLIKRYVILFLFLAFVICSIAQTGHCETDDLPQYPLAESLTYCKNDLGRPLSRTRYHYDRKKRPTRIVSYIYAQENDTSVKEIKEMVYNEAGQLAEVKSVRFDGTRMVRSQLSVMRYEGTQLAAQSDEGTRLVESVYDDKGRLSKRIEKYPAWTTVVKFEYDSSGRLARSFGNPGDLTNYHYEGDRLVRREDHGSDIVHLYYYGSDKLLAEKTTAYRGVYHYFQVPLCREIVSRYFYFRTEDIR